MLIYPLTAVRAEDSGPRNRHVGLLFDWDGTVADSQPVNFAALAEALPSTE